MSPKSANGSRGAPPDPTPGSEAGGISEAPGPSPRVLCSPSPAHRQTLRDALADAGLEGSWLTRPEQHLDRLSEPRPCLLVLTADGGEKSRERLRRLRRLLDGRSSEILALCPDSRRERVPAVVEAGADDVLLLPGEAEHLPRRLAIAVRRLHRRSRGAAGGDGRFHPFDPHLRWAMDQLPSLLWATDLQLRIISVAGAGVATFEPSPDPGRQATLHDLFDSERPEFPPIAAARKALGGEASRFEFEWLGYSFEGRTEPLRDHRRRIVGCMGFALDVSDRRQAEQELSVQQAYFQQLFENSPQAIVLVDPQDRLLKVNGGFEELFGYRQQELVGRRLASAIVPKGYREEGEALSEAVLSGETVHLETVRRHRSGRELQTSILGYPIRHEDRIIGVFGIYEDITERKRTEERLRHNALHDSLTGLPNRTLFVDRASHCLEREKRDADSLSAVLFLDLDHFKLINDSLGHGQGDQLLIAIADRLTTAIRPMDTVARLGGDEFVILLEEISGLEDAVRVAHRIQTGLAAPFDLGGTEVYITACIGISLSSGGYRYAGEMIRDADTAMYRAKARGRACHAVFDRRMHALALSRLQLETDLRRGLERQEFRLHYQPIVDLGNGRIESFEALLRWHHPLRGLLLPGEFLEVAEETGLTVELSSWVLAESCSQVQSWLDLQPDLGINVNLSTKQFLQPNLPAQLDAFVDSYCLPPGSLRLEITEGVILHPTETVVDSFNTLKANAIRLYLDDFGTGYSSLAYLETFPVDSLKIDRSFVSGSPGGVGKPEIARAIVSLAHSLGLEVVAEGIENDRQLAWVRSLGCEQGQGYFFSPPVPGDEATELLLRNPRW